MCPPTPLLPPTDRRPMYLVRNLSFSAARRRLFVLRLVCATDFVCRHGRPKMLSPRFRIEISGGGADDGRGSASAAGSSGRVTRSSSRKMALTPRVAGSGGGSVDNNSNDDLNDDDDNSSSINDNNNNNNTGSSSGTGHDEDIDGYDSEKCQTPELSSPLRSAHISARDLQVLTPSAARAGYGSNTGNGSYEGGSSDGHDRGGSGDDSDACPTPELSSPLRSSASAALCRRRLEEADGADDDEAAAATGGPLELVSEEEYAKVCMRRGQRQWAVA